MRTLIWVSAFALLVAGCDQLSGSTETAEVDSAPTAPEPTGDLNIAEPMYSQLAGQWWAADQNTLETGFGEFVTYDTDSVIWVRLISDSERQTLHQMGMSDEDIDRHGTEQAFVQVVTSCADPTPNVEGRAFQAISDRSCVDFVSIENNVLNLSEPSTSTTGQYYRVSGDLASRLDARKESYLSWRATSP